MKAIDFFELLFLGAIWGASFILIKYAAPEFGIFTLVEIRALGASLLLLPLVFLKRSHAVLFTHWHHLLIVGLLNTVIPFCLFNYGLLHIQAGLAAILNATAPMFGVLIAYLYLKESIGKLGLFGVLLGFFGVVLISYEQNTEGDTSLIPILAILLATFCYGIAAAYLRSKLSNVNAFALAGGSQLFSALALLPLALIDMPTSLPSPQAITSALILAFVCTGLAYVLYFDLIAKVGAPRAMTVGYLVPLFGIVWGYIIMNETLSELTLLGGGLILLGVMLATNVVERFIRYKKRV
ncbi:DMT family transporter [Glaciecola sp. 2405UD65-10]|uniref:DMT family transporter n=1 Tax=Glaciecola sp. 2405UD65-10 TaxID=3397244 RepID=UPI003B5BAF82